MSYDLQNFYKTTLLLDWTIGTGNFYVTTLPTISTGWLVISPNNSTLREIVKYSATGTDGTGNYIIIITRGVGGTTEQTHSAGEPIRMNITAEYWASMQDDIDSIVAAGSSNANTTTRGIVEEATAAEIDAGTQTGSTGAELFINPKLLNDAHNIPLVVPGASGNLMTSNGTDWTSAAPTSLYSSVVSTGVQASGAVNYAHGLGVTPKRIKVTCFSRNSSGANSGIHSTSFGTYDGTNTRSIYNYGDSGNSFNPEGSTTVIATENVTNRTATATFNSTNVVLTWSGATDAGTALLIESWA